jgi:hypothetical protein
LSFNSGPEFPPRDRKVRGKFVVGSPLALKLHSNAVADAVASDCEDAIEVKQKVG